MGEHEQPAPRAAAVVLVAHAGHAHGAEGSCRGCVRRLALGCAADGLDRGRRAPASHGGPGARGDRAGRGRAPAELRPSAVRPRRGGHRRPGDQRPRRRHALRRRHRPQAAARAVPVRGVRSTSPGRPTSVRCTGSPPLALVGAALVARRRRPPARWGRGRRVVGRRPLRRAAPWRSSRSTPRRPTSPTSPSCPGAAAIVGPDGAAVVARWPAASLSAWRCCAGRAGSSASSPAMVGPVAPAGAGRRRRPPGAPVGRPVRPRRGRRRGRLGLVVPFSEFWRWTFTANGGFVLAGAPLGATLGAFAVTVAHVRRLARARSSRWSSWPPGDRLRGMAGVAPRPRPLALAGHRARVGRRRASGSSVTTGCRSLPPAVPAGRAGGHPACSRRLRRGPSAASPCPPWSASCSPPLDAGDVPPPAVTGTARRLCRRSTAEPAQPVMVWGNFPEVYWAGRPPARRRRWCTATSSPGSRAAGDAGPATPRDATPGAYDDLLLDNLAGHPPALMLDTSSADLRRLRRVPAVGLPGDRRLRAGALSQGRHRRRRRCVGAR